MFAKGFYFSIFCRNPLLLICVGSPSLILVSCCVLFGKDGFTIVSTTEMGISVVQCLPWLHFVEVQIFGCKTCVMFAFKKNRFVFSCFGLKA